MTTGVINFELVQPIWPRYLNVTDGQMGRTFDSNTALYTRYVHRAVQNDRYRVKVV